MSRWVEESGENGQVENGRKGQKKTGPGSYCDRNNSSYPVFIPLFSAFSPPFLSLQNPHGDNALLRHCFYCESFLP